MKEIIEWMDDIVIAILEFMTTILLDLIMVIIKVIILLLTPIWILPYFIIKVVIYEIRSYKDEHGNGWKYK